MSENTQDTSAMPGAAPLASVALPHESLQLTESALQMITRQAAAETRFRSLEGTYHFVVPEGYKHIDLTGIVEKAAPHPRRKAGTVTLGDLDSFITYVSDQGDPMTTRVYADVETRTLTAVLNDHSDYAEDNSAGWRDYRAVYQAELSREFSNWLSHNQKPMEQEAFAIFLEDNIADIQEPSGDTLLKVALTLQATTEVNFSSSKRLDNGQVQFQYTEATEARAGGGLLEIPREFSIGLRLFKGGEGFKIKARLKYRLGGGKLKFWYELDRPLNAVEAAFKEYVDQARSGPYALVIGKP
ncbi:DUF2303 family protein [Massilia endophytica]|uniref:DUF2303 family protein n=1 Tax=Massilia endophytica TaxID=2899220 RepID=UPI001E4E2878|nr:DUF2303 family protein [Massilia endophytica]UGQ45103.1 YfdQ family protein [Massilia endophytica]